jgi:hypothetical protein
MQQEAIPLNSLVVHTFYFYVKLDGGTLGPKHVKGKGKGKAIPLQAWTGPEGSRRLRFPDWKTIAVRMSALGIGRLYPPRYIPGTHFC